MMVRPGCCSRSLVCTFSISFFTSSLARFMMSLMISICGVGATIGEKRMGTSKGGSVTATPCYIA